jgi:hypothetical protein
MIPPPNLPPTLAPQLSLPHLARRAEPSPRSTGSDSLSYSLARLPTSFAPAGLRLCGCATGDAAAYPICSFRSRFVHRCAILSDTMLSPMITEQGRSGSQRDTQDQQGPCFRGLAGEARLHDRRETIVRYFVRFTAATRPGYGSTAFPFHHTFFGPNSKMAKCRCGVR